MILANLTKAIREQNYYAVVLEFLIVIAGVVIGFQITAWNAEWAEADLEQRYLERLHQAVTQDIVAFEDAVELANARRGRITDLIAGLEDPQIVEADPSGFAIAVNVASYTFYPSISDGVVEEMTSTGNSAIIGSEALRSQISNYYDAVKSVRQWDYLRESIQTVYTQRRAGVFTFEQASRLSDDYMNAEFSVEEALDIRERVLERPELIAWLGEAAGWQSFQANTFAEHARMARALQDMLARSVDLPKANITP